MANVSVYNMEGSEVGKMDLNDDVFAAKVNEHLMHMAVVLQLANKRQGTQSAKTRSEVRGGGKKPWRQKGTGHARQGSIRAPQWTGGGVVFAPKPRDYSFKMNRKEKAAAIRSALTSRVDENKFLVMDSLKFDEIKTKKMVGVLDALKVKKALVVLDGEDNANVELSARNIKGVRVVPFNSINVYDILKYETVVITKNAVSKIEEVYA
ncbi:50S ribosomal protein L4 [bacterium D16-51]|nr:50S ribosomal protein L4 [bacterium D16-59]RKI61486.1 50S ribosomal protein L4 [bacterium D16-51]